MAYSEKLKSPLWQKRRLEILSRDNFTCLLCGDTETELHVHHKKYVYNNDPWNYPDDNFQTLCKHCHGMAEKCKPREFVKISKYPTDNPSIITMMGVYMVEGDKPIMQISGFENNEYYEIIAISKLTANRFLDVFVKAEEIFNTPCKD